jgi:hypothetical protein
MENNTIKSWKFPLPFMVMHRRCIHFLQDGASYHALKRIKDFQTDKPFKVIN